MTFKYPLLSILMLSLTACHTLSSVPQSNQHITASPDTSSPIPDPVLTVASLPKPKPYAKVETFSVVVNNVKAQDLLFALARDAKLNIDIHPNISGTVTLNAIDQSLQQILNRISRQIDMRWELDGPNLVVLPDSPFLRSYQVDYVNMSRDTSGSVTVTTQIASTGSIGGTSTGGNNSLTKIDNIAKNHFWETLEKNIKDLLRETDKVFPEGASDIVEEPVKGGTTVGTTIRKSTFREAAAVIVNPESGVVTVRATGRQHDKVQEFISRVMVSVKRQVLIEATIAEVQLSEAFQQGINWSAAPLGKAGFTLKQGVSGTLTSPPQSIFQLSYSNAQANITSLVQLLESFGTVKVLSSPKMSVLNNQTAVLKVVDNQVYFTIKADTTSTANVGTATSFTTDLHSVPVGFVMNVTPQISNTQTVLLNIRPSISRIIGYVADPNPSLKATKQNGFDADIVSQIPVIRTREMESMIRIDNGNIAVMGGLMEDSMSNTTDAIPGLSQLPGVGNLFKNRNESRTKTELIVFLRPVVIVEPEDYKISLPSKDFFGGNGQ